MVEHKKKIKWLCSAIVILIIIGIVAGFMYHNNNLNNQLESIKEELEVIMAEKESVETQLKHMENKLNATQEELRIAYEKIEVQLEQIEEYRQVIEDEELKWMRRYEEYPVATEAWIAMKTLGWNDIVCAGIMGNLIAETGGSTLHLNWDIDGSSGYGLVQWIDSRRKEIKSIYGAYPSVKEQVQFIHDELFGTNGVTCQVDNGQLNAIMNAETPEDCAYAFACYYERCAEQYISIRRYFARNAYDYFVDL